MELTLIRAVVIFTQVMELIIIIDIIMSFLSPLLDKIRYNSTYRILWPLYEQINKRINTNVWPFKLDALVLILILFLIRYVVVSFAV